MIDVDAVARAYVDCAIWSETDTDRPDCPGGAETWDDVAPDDLAHIVEMVSSFVEDNASDILASGMSAEQCGHDLWLTRNRHGAGFWDRGYPGPIGDRLTAAAHSLGGSYVTVDAAGRVTIDQ